MISSVGNDSGISLSPISHVGGCDDGETGESFRFLMALLMWFSPFCSESECQELNLVGYTMHVMRLSPQS